MSEERGGAYAELNGLNFYYEVHGEGEPLILPLLAEGRQVIGVDLQAHGRIADIDRPMTYEAMADDVAALIEHLSVGEANVMGYSLGGAGDARDDRGRGCRQHPSCARRGVLRAARSRREGRRVGRVRDARVPARQPARHYALRHLLLSRAGVRRRAVPRRTRSGREMSRIRKEVTCQDR